MDACSSLCIRGFVHVCTQVACQTLNSQSASPYKEEEALKLLYAHMSEDSKVEEMVRKLYAKKNGDKSVQIDKKALKEMVERFR